MPHPADHPPAHAHLLALCDLEFGLEEGDPPFDVTDHHLCQAQQYRELTRLLIDLDQAPFRV